LNFAELKQKTIQEIGNNQDSLWGIASKLYENPELAFNEFQSMRVLTDFLANAGFEIEKGIGGLETSFQAVRYGKGNLPNVAFLAEYDALPEIGHACGHNLIAASAVGAALGVSAVFDSISGQIRVIGTPAEEKGGGKRIMVEAGVFNNIDAAMMIHPASKNMVLRGSLASMRLCLEFFGKTSHAAASPQEGVNALDAVILTFNNINALRQHLEVKDRIAGIITHGGDAANIIPGYTTAEFSVRGESEKRREEVLQKVIGCAEAAALATGCQLKYEAMPGYAEILPNQVIGKLFAENLSALGRDVVAPGPNERMGSTDMGNVSKVIPSLHPYLETVSEDVAGHTVEFREICMSDKGKSTMLDGAKAMAMTAVDLLLDPSLVAESRAELDNHLNN
jgi:amidohydrolase